MAARPKENVMQNRQTAERVQEWARAHFTYMTDEQAYGKIEFWATSDEIIASMKKNNGILFDDCDGYATMCVAMLRKMGCPARFVTCFDKTLDSWHCVAECEGWILDNNSVYINAAQDVDHLTWVAISGFNPGDPWSKIDGLI